MSAIKIDVAIIPSLLFEQVFVFAKFVIQETFTCSKSTMKRTKYVKRRSGIFIVSFEKISEIFLMFPVTTLKSKSRLRNYTE